MPNTPATTPALVAVSPRRSGRLFVLSALVAALWSLPATAAAPVAATVHTYSVLPEVAATVRADGSLTITAATNQTPLLSTEVVSLSTGRRGREDKTHPFAMVVAEGAAGGQRGFSAHCDDDNDGAVDEDPLDGEDNDGDGRVDEDFAAISDAMVVVHQDGHRGGGRAAHLEYYHWSYAQLRSTVFLSAKGSPGLTNGGTYRLALGDHDWQEATLVSPRHTLAGTPEASRVEGYVAQPGRVESTGCGGPDNLWLGVVVLANEPGRPAVLAGGVLELPLGEDPVFLAVCTAESWLQLNHMMNEAVLVQRGATDKITGRQAPWIVPPLCALCRLSEAPDFTWSLTGSGNLMLTAEIQPGRGLTVDPDLFNLGGQALGAPREISWQPAGGEPLTVAWTCLNAALLNGPHDRLSNPYDYLTGLLSHEAAGRLSFVFARRPASLIHGVKSVRGSYLDGRVFEAVLAEGSGPPAAAMTADPVRVLRSEDRQPRLSPQLLEGFPNPFRDHIQLRFRVPATVGEGFVWGDDDQEPPADVDLQAAMPWPGGTPSVSVRIYSLNGQELLTLYSASQGPGENTVQWDGTDSYGRQVASGTYFCKLQMDEWSVTRRLVYLR